MIRSTVDLEGVHVLDFEPPDASGTAMIHATNKHGDAVRFEIDRGNVDLWRQIFAQGLGICECIQPTGLEVVMAVESVRVQ